jgi:preprotein translocase subunit SecG
MQTFVTVIHVMTCILLILVVLPQSGKGADISASLGGSSQTIFGSSGGANLFTRVTSVLAAIFFVTSLSLTVLRSQSRKSLFSGSSAAATTTETPPAATAPDAKAPTAPAANETTPAAAESKDAAAPAAPQKTQ